MPWLKRNIYTVIGAAVAIGLLILAILFLLSKRSLDQERTDQLAQQTEQLRMLVNRDPYPNEANIERAKEALEKLQVFAEELRSEFPPAPVPEQISSRDFGLLLDNTISDLQRRSEKGGVTIPDDYWFTFAAQKNEVQFTNIDQLASRLAEVKALSEILLDAKINKLSGIKRPPVGEEKTPGSLDYIDAKPVTNNWAIITPYEVTFQSFSAELAKVMEALANSPIGFVVKNVAVDPAPDETKNQQLTRGSGRLPYGAMQRYQDPRYMPAPRAPVPNYQTPSARGGMVDLLDEQLLQFTLSIEVITRKPSPPDKKS